MENYTPQLVMRRPHLCDLPPIELPDEYSIRSFREGDEPYWEKIIRISFDDSQYEFDKTMRNDPAFQPERIQFVVHDDIPVATASAWWVDRYGPDDGYLHMVGVSPDHRGKRLGYWVSLAVLHHFVWEHRTQAVLQTDDFRQPAIRTYIRMGFEPMLVHENQRGRWKTVLQEISCQDLLTTYQPILDGPVHQISL